MNRRDFLQAVPTAAATSAAASVAIAKVDPGAVAGSKTWLFWDLWKLDNLQGVTLRQGVARWRKEFTYQDPAVSSFSTWPLVYRDESAGKWRMLYTARWQPYTLLVAASEDGLHWKPEPHPEIAPPGGSKVAPHHLFTLESGSGGGPYLDPRAADGNRFRVFAIQHGEPAVRRAQADPKHLFHAAARAGLKNKRIAVDHLTLVSRDGLHWKADYEAGWGQPGWHPEPPVYAFYNHRLKMHAMTSRTGHGERRVVIQTSRDARNWSGPELLLQPDPSDAPLVQFYGMPVVPYENHFVGLLWHFHIGDSTALNRYNHYIGPLDCHLAYSYDSVRFARGLRQPFIALNDPGEPGSGVIQTSCMVDAGEELRFYSSACTRMHGLSEKGAGAVHILLHTVRRDGFFYLESTGNWGSIISKPLALWDPTITVNAAAPTGEIQFQVTDLESNPIPGLTYDDCVALREGDQIRFPLRWKGSLEGVLRKPVRLAARFRHARLYAIRGNFHFLDAQDWLMLDEQLPIDTRWFDY